MSRGPEKQFDPEVALEKAMEVFWAQGYEAASLSQLLKCMEIGRKSLYDTFGNKRSLFPNVSYKLFRQISMHLSS